MMIIGPCHVCDCRGTVTAALTRRRIQAEASLGLRLTVAMLPSANLPRARARACLAGGGQPSKPEFNVTATRGTGRSRAGSPRQGGRRPFRATGHDRAGMHFAVL